jgi:spore coat polysaccharide biosynthesis protein SpsF
MNVVLITQARMSSTRLPGKVMLQVQNKPLLAYHLERLERVTLADRVVVATSTNSADDLIAQFCRDRGVYFFRGDELDVLSRYYMCAKAYAADVIVRVTSDCPVIDPDIIDRVIAEYLAHRDHVDYVSNVQTRTFPRGMDTEVFSFEALQDAYVHATAPLEREHVTPYIYRREHKYKLLSVTDIEDASSYRLTVDTEDDFRLISQVLEKLYAKNPNFTLQDMIELFSYHPELLQINQLVRQKELGE